VFKRLSPRILAPISVEEEPRELSSEQIELERLKYELRKKQMEMNEKFGISTTE
jgi:hypothetical protein